MLTRLLESKKSAKRSIWGALASTLAHTTAIGIAVFATAQARDDHPTSAETVRWVAPALPRPLPRPGHSGRPARSEPQVRPPVVAALNVDRIDVVIPPVDLTLPKPSIDAGENVGPPIAGVPRPNRGGELEPAEPFAADQVERQVYLRPGNPPPRYPNALRSAGIEGQVIALFVVNEAGRVELTGLRFTRSDNPLFEAAVRDALSNMRFGAAEVSGKKVRQLVQMPFVFSLSR